MRQDITTIAFKSVSFNGSRTYSLQGAPDYKIDGVVGQRTCRPTKTIRAYKPREVPQRHGNGGRRFRCLCRSAWSRLVIDVGLGREIERRSDVTS